MSIMNHFPGKPRKVQTQILETLEANWNDYDVFIISAPVASGKTRIAVTLADWLREEKNQASAILTPTNVLVQQYRKEFKDLQSLSRRNSYFSTPEFLAERSKFRQADQILANYYVYLSNRAYREVVIFDEAHNVLQMLSGGSIKLWKHLYDWPDNLTTEPEVVEWLLENSTESEHRNKKLRKALKQLEDPNTESLVELTTEAYRGRDRAVLKITPLDARNTSPYLWPRKVRKIVMMSATINKYDIYDMGLDEKRVLYIEGDSPIPPANRPVVPLGAAKINYSNHDISLPRVAEEINRLLDKHPESGVIHCTYDIAEKLSKLLDNPRFLWHTRSTRDKVYKEFISGTHGVGRVLVACGMSEGVDLAYDLARWQCIVKIPYLSLADPVITAQLTKRPEAYAWWAVRSILQATGRVCRTPTDKGWTYILDSNFRRLYNDYPNLWPRWFREAVRQ